MGFVNKRIDATQDGISHINMYSKAKTPLGRMLSDFYHYPIETEDGHFESVEGYWYYLSLPATVDRDRMRRLYGFMAKNTGRELRKQAGEKNLLHDNRFEEKILSAIRQKVSANKKLILPEYVGLPIIHYYMLPDGRAYDVTKDFEWLVSGIQSIVEETAIAKRKERQK